MRLLVLASTRDRQLSILDFAGSFTAKRSEDRGLSLYLLSDIGG